MSVDTSVLHISVEKVENMRGPEEDLVAEDSPIRDCRRSLKPTVATICGFRLKVVHLENDFVRQ